MFPLAATFPVRRFLTLATLLVALATGAAAVSHAQTWAEVGDAGDMPVTAQATVGNGALTTITGFLSSPGDVDVYCIETGEMVRALDIPVVRLGCVMDAGPNVWVFDASGLGISTNGSCLGGYKVLTTTLLQPYTTYYVAVSYSGVNPFSGAGAVWLTGLPAERAPDGPGGAGALTGWAGTAIVQVPNPYQLDLSFITYCDGATPVARPTWGSLKVRYGN